MTISANPVRGTRDYLPKEMRLREAMQNIILNVYQEAGFQRIHTPILEDIERLDKSDGGENLNLIFKILKRGQKLDLTKENLTENDLADAGLRFDLTMPLSRYYANNRAELRMPFKVIQIDQVFRAERPQKGRLREFFQCDIDIIGDESSRAETELIHTTAKALKALGFTDFTVRINDRRILTGLILTAGFQPEDVGSVCITFDKLDKIGAEGVKKELLEKGYPENVVEKFAGSLLAGGISDLSAAGELCGNPEAAAGLAAIMDRAKTLAAGSYNVEYDPSLVRGMGYYTGTIFEIASPKFKSSIAGGGRYDKMIGKYLGEDIPAVGFSIGFERIFEILSESEEIPFALGKDRLALLYNAEDDFIEVIKKAEELRAEGYAVATMVKAKKLGKQFTNLEKDGFLGAHILGEEGIKIFGARE
ncbi:MAG: histidine--tRNA ligase [Clostridiales bacterium]|nr:histidine--tRNA ligase [Clostridiales bacterium]MBQ3107269.1 histidine--tRNA ligase [Bacillota bacterium]